MIRTSKLEYTWIHIKNSRKFINILRNNWFWWRVTENWRSDCIDTSPSLYIINFQSQFLCTPFEYAFLKMAANDSSYPVTDILSTNLLVIRIMIEMHNT